MGFGLRGQRSRMARPYLSSRVHSGHSSIASKSPSKPNALKLKGFLPVWCSRQYKATKRVRTLISRFSFLPGSRFIPPAFYFRAYAKKPGRTAHEGSKATGFLKFVIEEMTLCSGSFHRMEQGPYISTSTFRTGRLDLRVLVLKALRRDGR
jgi:hypothetical protein